MTTGTVRQSPDPVRDGPPDPDEVEAVVPPDPPAPASARSRATGFSFAIVSGYVVGVAGFYTNFFATLLQATAALVDVLGVIFLVWLVVRWWPRRTAARARRGPTMVAAALTALCLLLMGSATYAAVHPPGAAPTSLAETCLYDVSAGTSIPLVPDGRVKAEIPLRASDIFAVSVVIGLDPTTADRGAAHPVDLRVSTGSAGSSKLLHQPDIRDNHFTRFNFPTPIHPAGRATTLTVEIINKSAEPIGVYVKVPDDGDVVPAPLTGVVVRGHAGQEASYRRTDWALTGCVAGSS